ncbi:MAG: hypothetical protein ACRYG2_05055 [Janthinobacterium lividum]
MSLSDKADDLSSSAKDVAGGAVHAVASGGGIVAALSNAGVKSEWAYAGAFATIGLTYVSYFASRGKKGDSKAQADRWGIFISTWPPTLFALGNALKLAETH